MKEFSGQNYVSYRLKLAKETLDAAHSLTRDKHWNPVINRLYYTCFYAVSALLYKNEINAKSHSGIKHQFGLHIVKTGLIDKTSTEIYLNLFDFRQIGDYADLIDFDEEQTTPLIPQTENFIKKIEELINKE